MEAGGWDFRPSMEPESYPRPDRFAIERVDLRKDGFNLAINLAPLISHKAGVPDGARLTITKSLPLLLKRRGVELRIVLEGEATSTVRTDPSLIDCTRVPNRVSNLTLDTGGVHICHMLGGEA
jgi:hypothetical protein